MKQIHLPHLKRIRIDNYYLYQQCPSFEFHFKDGISAIIGGNGIGKTTFVEIVIYCLVGYQRIYKEKARKDAKNTDLIVKDKTDFFRVRIDDKYDKTIAAAYLEFDLNNNKVIIGRSLFEDKVIHLDINGEKITPCTEESYEKLITSISGISTFRAFEEIIRTFLFFDELRKNIAWDPDTQDKILRILLFDEEYFLRFEQLEKEVIRWDSIGRHESENRRIEKESLEKLENEKNQVLKQNNKDEIRNSIDNLYMQKNELEIQISELQAHIEEKLEVFNNYNNELNILVAEEEEIQIELDEKNKQVDKLETKLFSSMYNKLPNFYINVERAIKEKGKCLICGAESKQIQRMAIEKVTAKQCLVCSSEVLPQEELDPQIINTLNDLNQSKNDLVNRIKNKQIEITELDAKIQVINKTRVEQDEILNSKKRSLIYIDSLISNINAKNNTDTYNEIVKRIQERIEELTKLVNEAYKERNKLQKELKSLHNKFKSTIKHLNSSISEYFNKYANAFTGMECELSVNERTINKVPHVIYLPKVNGTLRKDIWAVSESQRFFLDQAFRMAIIDYLQNTVPNFETFFITETPEGSLDIAYENQVANMFKIFAESKNNIIFVFVN